MVKTEREVGHEEVQIEGVPVILQRKGPWCGYASLAMLLQFWGKDITPDAVFQQVHPDGNEKLEYQDEVGEWLGKPAPTMHTLAIAARELTSQPVKVLDKKAYELLGREPEDVLKTFIRGGIPCMVRMPRHLVVVTGFDTNKGEYTYNNPLGGKVTKPAGQFERNWAASEGGYPRDTRNLMLVIYPQRKTSTNL